MKIKTLLFGAGPGATFYMEKNAEIRHFLGILDNDPLKLNTEFAGLEIFSAESVKSFEFDEIVITTQWASAVKVQLVKDYFIEESRIVIPEKHQLKEDSKPFYNENSRELARDIVININVLAVKRKLSLVIDFGTLLGIVRDDDIIEWDDDIDFAAPQEEAGGVEALLRAFVQSRNDFDWVLERVQDVRGQTTSFQLKFSDPSGRYVPFITSVAMRSNEAGRSIHLPSLGMWYSPQKHFDRISLYTWRGQKLQVPHDYLAYLDFQYGDWQTPKKNIKYSDYANLQEVDFSEVKTANWQLRELNTEDDVSNE